MPVRVTAIPITTCGRGPVVLGVPVAAKPHRLPNPVVTVVWQRFAAVVAGDGPISSVTGTGGIGEHQIHFRSRRVAVAQNTCTANSSATSSSRSIAR